MDSERKGNMVLPLPFVAAPEGIMMGLIPVLKGAARRVLGAMMASPDFSLSALQRDREYRTSKREEY